MDRMDLMPDGYSTHWKTRKKKKRREAETISDWMKIEPETELVDALNDNADFLTSDTNQIQGLSKKKKRSEKRKNGEINLKTKDFREDVASGQLEINLKPSGSELQDDNSLEEAKHITKKKKKKKRRQDALEGTQSQEVVPGEERFDSREMSCDRASASPSLLLTEQHFHKCKKKKKQKMPEHHPSAAIITDEETVSDSAEKTTGDVRHKKRKRKAKGNLQDMNNNDDSDGDQTSTEKTTVDEKRPVDPGYSGSGLQDDYLLEEAKPIPKKKKKKKRRQGVLEGTQSQEVVLGEERIDSRVVLSASPSSFVMEHHPHKHKKKKKQRIHEHHPSEAIITDEETVPDSAEKTTCDVRHKKLKRKVNGNLQDSDGDQTSKEKTIVDEKRHKKRRKKAKGSNLPVMHDERLRDENKDNADDGDQSFQNSWMNTTVDEKRHKKAKRKILKKKNHSPSKNEKSHSPDHGSRKKKKSSPEDTQDGDEGGIETFKRTSADAPEKWIWPSINEEKEEEWIKDLPFYYENNQRRGRWAIPKEGVALKRGRWSGLDDRILRGNVLNFCKQYGIKNPRMVVLPHLYENCDSIRHFLRAGEYLLKICKGLKRLPFDAYIRARKIFDDQNYKGAFTEAEKRNVRQLKLVHGNKWSQIGRRIGRSGQSVLNWYRGVKEGTASGRWKIWEQEQLKQAVMAVTESDDVTILDRLVGIPWREVHKMVPTRGLHQCMVQWKYTVCWSIGNRTKRRWQTADSVKLIESIYGLEINEESDIDWSELFKEFMERAPSPAKLSLMWHLLKLRHLENYNFMTFEDILDELYHKVLPVFRKKLAHITSKEFISDSEEDSGDEW